MADKIHTILGARDLRNEELIKIIPNIENIYNQIKDMREAVKDFYDKQQNKIKENNWNQKMNNIGILGRRGTGKSSVLRTISKKLEEENADSAQKKKKGDIILPFIIPENLSEEISLMDTILGMLKKVIDEERTESKQDNENCIFSVKDKVKKCMVQVLKQYCYVKKDYRKVLLQQFTTEQAYVNKTAEIFNSDSELLRYFDQLLETLFADREKGSMLFIFIDDIDLSSTRTIDLVRTLLSYLSHYRIVTFLAGDMDNFEESLTLEFLRQEQALSKDLFSETFYLEKNDTLLASKKKLAYEYLKKIIPPSNRYTLRYWSIEERGTYFYAEMQEGQHITLTELLNNLFVKMNTEQEWKKGYFSRHDECINYAYTIFDDTSRGLNNVYNVLLELYHAFETEETETKKIESEINDLKWRLLETIISSNQLFAINAKVLTEEVIVRTEENVKINDSRLYYLLYPMIKEEGANKQNNNEKNVGTDSEYSVTEMLAFYYLVDFAKQLFCVSEIEEDIQLRRMLLAYCMSVPVWEDVKSNKNFDIKKLEFLEQNKDTKKLIRYDDMKDCMIEIFVHAELSICLYLIQLLKKDFLEKISVICTLGR